MAKIKFSNDYAIGDVIEILPSKYWPDNYHGRAYVVGYCGENDLKVSKRPGGDWDLIVHLQTVEGSGRE